MDKITHAGSQDTQGVSSYGAQIGEKIMPAESSDSSTQRRDWQDKADDDANEQERRPRCNKKSYSQTHFKVYKRRWFGLAQLGLLNIVAAWDWLTFAPISTTAATYFRSTETSINWLSTAILFAFIAACPFTIHALHQGPKDSIITASVLLLLGNWIRYAGTIAKGGIFGVVMFGQILTGLAQPFVLAAPTRYSDMWFTERGRVGATALATLANPLGGALAQLINPFLGTIPQVVLVVSIIATIACIPSIFIPAAPPTPPTSSSSLSKTSIVKSLTVIRQSPSFYVIFVIFSIFIGCFNATSSLLNQILYPYGFSEDEAGICGAILIAVGLVTAAVMSPIFDRTHAYLLGIKILCPLLALSYVALIWAPQTRALLAPYLISAVLGASSFSLLPVVLEYLVEVTFPASPEVSSTMCWVGGQLFGAIFIIVMDELKDERSIDTDMARGNGRSIGGDARPAGNMHNALIFQAVGALVAMSLPLMLGVEKFGLAQKEARFVLDKHGDGQIVRELPMDRQEQCS